MESERFQTQFFTWCHGYNAQTDVPSVMFSYLLIVSLEDIIIIVVVLVVNKYFYEEVTFWNFGLNHDLNGFL